MNEAPQPNTQTTGAGSALESGGAPPGDHPLEVAARAGFGPLSPAAIEAWHGGAEPCVTCGQLVWRGALVCDHCGQDLSPEMRARMRAHSGPWYVLEHVRPFPGVSLDRIIRQVHRGLITETSIVRGPATDYQWRFAVETPGLCRLFRRCWHCHGEAKLAETQCQACGASLSFDRSISAAGPGTSGRSHGYANAIGQRTVAAPSGSAVGGDGEQLDMLRAAAQRVKRHRSSEPSADVMKVGGIRLAWVAVVIVIAVFAALVWITQARTAEMSPKPVSAAPNVSPPSASDQRPSEGTTEHP